MKAMFYTFGSLAILMLLAMFFFRWVDFSPADLSAPDLEINLLPYRLGFYLLVFIFIRPISRALSAPRMPSTEITPDIMEKWDGLTEGLVARRWHVMGFFAFWELFVIHQVTVYLL